jgi:hypothetical protein
VNSVVIVLGNAANLVTVLGGVFVLIAFGWRVLRRLAEIVRLLRVVHELTRRITRIEAFLGLSPLPPRGDTP